MAKTTQQNITGAIQIQSYIDKYNVRVTVALCSDGSIWSKSSDNPGRGWVCLNEGEPKK